MKKRDIPNEEKYCKGQLEMRFRMRTRENILNQFTSLPIQMKLAH